MQLKRTVVGIQTQFFPTGSNFTIPAAGVASSSSKPGATDPAWLLFGNVKWGMEGDHKSETYMEPTPGAYAATDKILLSIGRDLVTDPLSGQDQLGAAIGCIGKVGGGKGV